MNLTDLENLDSSLKKIKCNNPSASIEALGNIRKISEKNLIFIKDDKNLKILQKVASKNIETVVAICSDEFADQVKEIDFAAAFTSKDINTSFLKWSKIFYDKKMDGLNLLKNERELLPATAQVADNVFIGEKVKIGKDVVIHSGCTIMAGSVIGDNVEIHPSVVLYPFTKVGNGCQIHSSTTIGADGFGYIYHEGEHQKIWHFGGVHIYDNVEIGANTSIDGGTFTPTVIGHGSKIDNQVQIGHNCELGKLVIVCGGANIGGSVRLEDGCVIGGSASLRDGIVIGAGSQVAGNSGVAGSWPAKSVVAGYPARPRKEWLRSLAVMRKAALRK